MNLKDIADEALKRIACRATHHTTVIQSAEILKQSATKGSCKNTGEDALLKEIKETPITSSALQQNESPTKVISWQAADQFLIDWFLNANNLPTEPFQITSAVKVIEPYKFYASLRQDIAQGTEGARARLGSLQSDLRHLKRIIEGKSHD